jgi:hypothetical protein
MIIENRSNETILRLEALKEDFYTEWGVDPTVAFVGTEEVISLCSTIGGFGAQLEFSVAIISGMRVRKASSKKHLSVAAKARSAYEVNRVYCSRDMLPCVDLIGSGIKNSLGYGLSARGECVMPLLSP